MTFPVTGPTTNDVQAVQDGIDSKDPDVLLQGTFNFGTGSVKVKVDHPLTIRGDLSSGKKPTITGGGGVFTTGMLAGTAYPAIDVIAPGQSVTIQDLHFIDPTVNAIMIEAVDILVISGCTIDGVLPATVKQADGTSFSTAVGILAALTSSGRLTITGNDIDIGASAQHRTLGIAILQSGQRGVIVDLTVTGNKVTNVTGFGMDFRNIEGLAAIEGNTIVMGTEYNPNVLVTGIRCLGVGIYVVRGNTIDCGFERSAGIRLHTTPLVASDGETGTTVDNNQITMSLPSGAVPDDRNAGIQLRGNVWGKIVSNNTILGSARAALSLILDVQTSLQSGGTPGANTLDGNHHENFSPILADIVVETGVTDTQIVAPAKFLDSKSCLAGTIADFGKNTAVTGDYCRPDGTPFKPKKPQGPSDRPDKRPPR